ncbi:hypothetical protein HK405_006897, partial [Cladochytrium tenue]
MILGVKCNGDGDKPLHVALKFEGAGAVAKLLSLVARVDIDNKVQQHTIHLEAAAPVDSWANAGDLQIHLTAESGNVHVIQMLLGVAADPCAWDVANGNSLRPIHVAYIHSHMDAVKVLLEDGAADWTCDADRINLCQLWA